MLDDLLPYYEKEVSHLRFLGQEFARQYPKIASRLLMEGDNCEDPHIERLIEAFSFLAARIHKKLDDGFPEIVESFLEVLYPHYLRPTPSLSICEFGIGTAEKISDCHVIKRHSQVSSVPVNGVVCKFRTCYPVDLWPIVVLDAAFVELEQSAFNGHSAALKAQLRISLSATADVQFGQMDIQNLRFFLDGESTLMLQLYELLFNNVAKATIAFSENGLRKEVRLPPGSLKSVGFQPDEGLVDYSERSFMGYRLIHEYFTFPEKFMFFDLCGFHQILNGKNVSDIEFSFYFSDFELADRLSRLAQNIGAGNFKLGCAPVINLFQHQADPIILTHRSQEYVVSPDVRTRLHSEVISIDRVVRVKEINGVADPTACYPFFEPRGDLGLNASYWIGRRHPSERIGDSGTHMSIKVVDRELDLIKPSSDTLSITLTCSNRDLPQYLSFGGAENDFALDNSAVVTKVRLLRKPTAVARVPLGDGLIWRLVSHLSLNHMSLVANGREVLQELLALYNYRNTAAIHKQINGIISIKSASIVARVGHPRPNFVRGVGITLELDESKYIGSGVYLFGTVLDHFFGQYCTMNSFTQLTLRTPQREKRIAQWPPRTGAQHLV